MRIQLWNRAQWHGVLYLTAGPNAPADVLPIMGLVFSERKAPVEIFGHWKEEQSRGELRLRVTVVRGVDRANPHAYTVMIGADPEASSGSGFVTIVSRQCRMDAASSTNLERFLVEYEKHRRYRLAPAYLPKATSLQSPAWASSLAIELKSLNVVEAWRIGVNDLERVVIRDDCAPVIPDGVVDAPVLEVLRQIRVRKAPAEKKTAAGRTEAGRKKPKKPKKRKKK
jgi:hypothetical protein